MNPSLLKVLFISILAVLENACMQQSFPDSLDWAKLKDAHFNARQHEHFLNILLVGTMIGSSRAKTIDRSTPALPLSDKWK